MRSFRTLLILVAILLRIEAVAAAAVVDVASAAAPIRAVIITGVDWPGHVWKETAPAVREALQKDPRFQVRIVEEPGFLASQELATFDVIVLHFKNYDPISQQQKAQENLLRLVRQGKGLVVIHYASGALEDWPEYRNLVGRTQQKKHDKRGPFTVKIVNHEHPVTKGMKDFMADDELFIELQGERPIEVLATAHSQLAGQDHPMAFVLQEGQGRVFHTTLGHDAKALRVPGTAELICRGATWAAGQTLP
jgi:uncharacterized protein